ncbi:MAG: hypothetical protein Fur0037_28850 [Planctomycetota bacterium]
MLAGALVLADARAAALFPVGMALGFALSRLPRRRKPRGPEAPCGRGDVAETAHELRTPLTSVITALDLLREEEDLAPADRHMFLEQATVAARHMAFLINDMLDSAALEAGKLKLNIGLQHLCDIAADVEQVMGIMARSRDIRLALAIPDEAIVFKADRARVLQVLFNLIGNAIKHSDSGSTILLLPSQAPPWCQFEIIDEGHGVADEVQPMLFGRFERGREDGRAHSSGLGLHVCRRIIELMGGEIGYRPRPEGGSVFWFRLPLVESLAPAAPADAPAGL